MDGRYPRVHRREQREPFPVNAYIVEGAKRIVVLDSLMTVSASKALRAKVDAIGKPLAAVLVTHAHPDHYAGLGNIVDARTPIVSLQTISDIMREDDQLKDSIVGPMFGDEWPQNRIFPTQIVRSDEVLEFDKDLIFEVVDVGPAESRHDSLFALRTQHPSIFVGDIVYGFMHAYMADGHGDSWRAALQRLGKLLPEDAILYPGHGAPVTTATFVWQRAYLETFEAAVRTADWSDPSRAAVEITGEMKRFLPVDDLLFLMQLSIEPTAKRLGLV